MNVQHNEAVKLVLDGHSLLLLGAAGTGKSFTIKHLIEQCRERRINVALTCTTGIACSVYPSHLQATTIHRWSGIGDGRHNLSDIAHVIKHNVKYREVVNRVRKCDVLVVDECSMLSKRFLDCLEKVCRMKNHELLFGGIQVVLCGDFRQLPPVPNMLYGEGGDFCFESSLFEEAFQHRVVLSEVQKQTEVQLIDAIQETSKGVLSDTSLAYIKSLNRPIKDDNIVKLFATNDQVEDYNRFQVDDFPGPVYQFESTDTVELRYLNSILAPKILWLKILAPVILLRNLSDKLVNGLQGVVYEIDERGPTIEFPSLGLTTTLTKSKFSVFSPRQNRDVAVREQYPLKLAFGLTIHKSQGMTMDSVEVDCRGIFKPGQLGVAMGRARSSAGLRVTNFGPRAIIKQPKKIEEFMTRGSSQDPLLDKTCCKVKSERMPMSTTNSTDDVKEPGQIPPTVTDSVEIIEEENIFFDEEFDIMISDMFNQTENISLPEDLNLQHILDNIKIKNEVTSDTEGEGEGELSKSDTDQPRKSKRIKKVKRISSESEPEENLSIDDKAGTSGTQTIHISKEKKATESDEKSIVGDKECTSVIDPVGKESEDTELCAACHLAEKEGKSSAEEIEWIACDGCSRCFHRNCAGLKHHLKWRKANKKGAKWYCNECL